MNIYICQCFCSLENIKPLWWIHKVTSKSSKFFWCAEHKAGIYHDHRVQISTSMILTNVLHPHLDVATDFPVVHHRGRSRAGCSHMTPDPPLGSQWGSSLCLGSSCPLMWWLQAVGFAWTHPPWHPSPLDPLHYSYSPEMGWGEKRNMEKEAPRFKTFSDHKELLLNLPWSGEHRDRAVFLRNWIWKQDWGSMGISLEAWWRSHSLKGDWWINVVPMVHFAIVRTDPSYCKWYCLIIGRVALMLMWNWCSSTL